ncbi:M28 family peptidase [Gemmatimonadota bacterium]
MKLRFSPAPLICLLWTVLGILPGCWDPGDAEMDPGFAETEAFPEEPDAFVAMDSVQVLADLRILSSDGMEGRRTGTRGADRARVYILTAFQRAGLEALPGGFTQPFEFQSRRDTTVVYRGENVVGLVSGSDPEAEAIVVSAHFDHVGIRNGEVYNGADDNASGTAALLSLVRYFTMYPPRHPVVFAAFDAEELGSRGAQAFVDAGWAERVALNVNMDMLARSDSILFAAGSHHYPTLRPVLEGVRAWSPVVLRFGHDEPGVSGMDDWTNSSDHRAFHRQSIPFIYFGVENHPDYHRPTDDFDRVDPAFFLNAVRTVLAAVLTLDDALD